MSRSGVSIPSYCHHKAKGLAYVQLNGHFIYLGAYNSPESKIAYQRTVTEWLARGRLPPQTNDQGAEFSINQMLLDYWKFAQGFYVNVDGSPSLELEKLGQAIVQLKSLYGTTPAAEFGPIALKAVRQKMIDDKLARTTINQRIRCIRRIFKWAVSEELIPASVLHSLQSVDGLKRGRCNARETEPVRPVPDEYVDAVLPYLCPTVRAMVQLQRHTGMRSGELCQLRTRDLETTGAIWFYRPQQHKTAHHGHQRIISIGPKGQEVLKPFLSTDLESRIFSPRRAREERFAAMRAKRKTKVQPSQQNRRKRRPKRPPGDHYVTKSYYSAVIYGIKAARKAGILPEDVTWHPHQLRHSYATKVRKSFTIDAARAVLGQRSLAIADTYAEIDASLASSVAAQIG